MSDRPDLTFSLRVGELPAAALAVHALRGEERLNGLYELTVDVTTELEEIAVEEVAPGQPARLEIRHGERRRAFHGIIAAARADGHRRAQGARVAQYRLKLAPRAFLLGLRRNSRVFQDARVDEVVRGILAPARIPSRWLLEGRYPTREYCTQYEETDLEFILRLTAEHGIGLHFEQPDAGAPEGAGAPWPSEILVFTDGVSERRAGATLRMRPDAGALQLPSEDSVLSFARGREVTSRAAAFHEYDPRRPHVRLGAERAFDEAGLPIASPEAGEPLGVVERPLEIYEHHGGYLFPDWQYERDEPDRILRSARRRRDVASGESACPWLAAGHPFQLEEHEIARLNGGWVPVLVVHEGRATPSPERGECAYVNHFECVPADVPYPPERPARRSVQVCLTATVVGGGEAGIDTDPGGHVRVRFHWDRERRAAGHDSCWVRVMQPWAGVGWGAQFIPRVGMEVVVTFEGGDPDKPLVLGCVYNGTSPPPFPLPQHATRSGLRTQSTPGGGGANELWFEDASGAERVYVHAQRDLEIAVRNDRVARVEHDELTQVGGDRRVRVGGEMRAEIRGSRESRVAVDDRLRVEGDRSSSTAGAAREDVEGDRSVRVGGRSRAELIGQRDLLAKSDVIERIEGSFVRIVGKPDAKRSHVTHVEGDLRASSSELVEIAADEGLVLRCGKSVVRVGPDKIELSSPELVLQGSGARVRLVGEELRLQADTLIQAVSEKILLKSSGAGIGLSSEAAVDGSRVLLNSPQLATDRVQPRAVEPTVIELRDEDGQPIANHPYRIVFEDGSELGGALDDEGRAVLELERGGQIYFPGLHRVTQE